MIEWGGKIPDIMIDELQAKLVETDDDGKAVKRLLAAITYKQGSSPAEIEETFGISKRTSTYGLTDSKNAASTGNLRQCPAWYRSTRRHR